MIFMLLPVALGDIRDMAVHMAPLDGDLNALTLMDDSIDFGLNPIAKTEVLRSGRRVKTEHLPTRLCPSYDRGGGGVASDKMAVPDFFQVGRGFVVSKAFRDLVEALDPAAHQFVPLTIDWGNERKDAGFSWFIPGHRVFAIDPEETRPDVRYFPDRDDVVTPDAHERAFIFRVGSKTSEWAPVFRKNQVRDCAVFCTGEFSGFVFMAERLWTAIQEEGLTGVRVRGPFALSG